MKALYKSPIPSKYFAPGHTHQMMIVIKVRAGYCIVRPLGVECLGTRVPIKYMIL